MPDPILIGPNNARRRWLKLKLVALPTINMVIQQKKKYEELQRKIMEEANKGGVRFHRTASTYKMVKLQGDEDLQSIDSLIKRVK